VQRRITVLSATGGRKGGDRDHPGCLQYGW
jgi:hypothetical protein